MTLIALNKMPLLISTGRRQALISPWTVLLLAFVCLPVSVRAPLPPCSPFLGLNKLVESNNWSSDMNPFYPVKPCPYKNPSQAPLRMRFAAFNNPLTNFYHVGTELAWLLHTGAPRALRMLLGREQFRMDNRILNEGYHSHYPGHGRNRVRHFGRQSKKRRKYYK